MKRKISSAMDIGLGVMLGFFVLDYISIFVLLIGIAIIVVIESEFL